MKRFAHVLILTALAGAPLHAQTPAAETPPPTRAEVETYVKELDSYIAGREQRAAQIVNQITDLDGSLQATVSSVVQKLKTITDSQDSKTKVARTKRDVMERIARAANYYASERAKLEEALRTSSNSFRREDLFKERAQFDSKIDQMVNAVVELALSMDSHQDFEKYLYEGGSDWWNDSLLIRKNPEYEQNRRATTQTDRAKTGVSSAIEKSLDRLQVRQNDLQAKIEQPGVSAAQKEQLQPELDRLTAIREERLAQLHTLASPAPQPTAPAGLNDAMHLEDMIEDVAANARRDISSIFARYRELRAERDAIAVQKAKLAHAEQWLKDNP